MTDLARHFQTVRGRVSVWAVVVGPARGFGSKVVGAVVFSFYQDYLSQAPAQKKVI